MSEYELAKIRTDRGEFKDKGNQVVDVTHPDFGRQGAKGDGVSDDTQAIADAIAFAVARGLPIYFPPGTYITGAATTVESARDVSIIGGGRGITTIKLADGEVEDENDAVYLLSIRNVDGTPITVSVSDLTLDMNLTGNPYVAAAALYESQHALRIQPMSARGINFFGSNIEILDPIADGINLSRGPDLTDNYGDIQLHGIRVSGRPDSYDGPRTDITITGLYDALTVSDVIVDTFQFETAATPDSTYAMATSISNSHFNKELDLVLTNWYTLLPIAPELLLIQNFGAEAKCLLNNVHVRGILNLGEWDFRISNSTFRLWQAARLIRGRYHFTGRCHIQAANDDDGTAFVDATHGLLYSLSGSLPRETVFDGTTFSVPDSFSTTDVPYFVARNAGPADAGMCSLEFINVKARGGIPLANFRSCDLRLDNVECDYNGEILNHVASTQSRTNRADIRDVKLTGGSSARLISWPNSGDPWVVTSRGCENTSSAGEIHAFDSSAEATCTFLTVDEAFGELTMTAAAPRVTGGRYWVTGSTTAVTSFTAPNGHTWRIRLAHAKTFTHGASLVMLGAQSASGQVGDIFTFEQRGGVSYEVARTTATPGGTTATVQTTGNSATALLTIGLSDATAYHVTASAVGVKEDGTARASYVRMATVYRTGGGSATLEGSVTAVHTVESDANWDCTIGVTSNSVRILVTGVAATTIDWRGTLTLTPIAEA